MRRYIRSISLASLYSTLSLVTSSLSTVVIGILISHLISKILSPEEYGNYYYVINLVTFSCVALSFGLFYSASRLVLKTQDDLEIRKIHGCTIICVLALSVLIPIVIFSVNAADVGLIKGGVDRLLVYAIPGAAAILLNSFFETVLPADKKLNILAKSRVLPKVLYLLFVVVVYFSWGAKGGGENILLLLFFSASLIGYIYYIKTLHPIFNGLSDTFRNIGNETKAYGIHVYFGSLFSVGGSALSGVAVGYFGDSNIDVGYFALASSLCAPLVIFPNALIAVNYRGFSSQRELSKKIIYGVILTMGGASFLLCSVSSYMVNLFWGVEYQAVNDYIYFLTMAYFLYAIADLLNKYLSARGMGKALRDGSFIVGFILILSTVVFIKSFGGIGVSYARIASGFVYLAVMLFFYKKYKLIPAGG